MSGDNIKTAGEMAIPMEKLTQPAILVLLAKSSAHGYELIQKLNQMDCIDGELEAATVYRTLRRMEQDGLIASQWQHGEYGPARRQYQLTGSGRKCLDDWAGGLLERRRQIDAFFVHYNTVKGI